jgi:CheY-like chemotaxis protein
MDTSVNERGWPPGLRVLVVEDHLDVAESTCLLLRCCGHDPAVAHDGPTALERAEEFRPEVVLLDIGLPGGMDGLEVARRLRASSVSPFPVLVAVTGYGDETNRRRSEQAGVHLHLIKPVDPEVLIGFLGRLTSGIT